MQTFCTTKVLSGPVFYAEKSFRNTAHLESAQNQGKQRIEDHEDKNDEKNNEDYVCRIQRKRLTD